MPEPGEFTIGFESGGPLLSAETYVKTLGDRLDAEARQLARGASTPAVTFVREGSPRAIAGLTHTRYRQRLDGRPILGSALLTHERSGELRSVNGRVYAPEAALATAPTLAADNARRRALSVHRQPAAPTSTAPLPHGQRPAAPAAPARPRPPVAAAKARVDTAELVYADRAHPHYSGTLALAWRLRVSTAGAPDAEEILLDATDGQLLHRRSLVAHTTVPGTVPTHYYGQQAVPVTALPNGGGFELRDDDRRIRAMSNASTFFGDPTGAPEPVRSASEDFTAANQRFGRMVFDIYFGADRLYDELQARFGWLGVDGNGSEMVGSAGDRPYSPFVNAYWDGEEAVFGQGDCHYQPLTSLDVVGHEFAHGITQQSSDLVYEGESGALNEAFSDIVGKALERIVAPEQFTWELGNRFADSPYAEGFRSMADPHLFDNPREVGDSLWVAGAGVHTNSGPLGHWFYLLVEGATGVNSRGQAYTVNAIGTDAALAHAFALNTTYLVADSDYADAYAGSLQLADDTYGPQSREALAIREAWRAIGLPGAGGGGSIHDIELIYADLDAYCRDETLAGGALYYSLTSPGPVAVDDLSLSFYDERSGRLLATYPFPSSTFTGDSIPPGTDYLQFDYLISDFAGRSSDEIHIEIDFAADTDPDNNAYTIYLDEAEPGIDVYLGSISPSGASCERGPRMLEAYVITTGCTVPTQDLSFEFFDASSVSLGVIRVTPPADFYEYGEFFDLELPAAWSRRAVRVVMTTPGDIPDDRNEATLPTLPEEALQPGRTLSGDTASEPYVGVVTSIYGGTVSRATTAAHGAAWVSTGSRYSVYDAPCMDPGFAIDLTYFVDPYLLLCVDIASAEEATLTFDAAALVGDPSTQYAELDGYRNALGVYLGEEATTAVAYHQSPDSESAQRVSVALSPGFSGPVRIALANVTGRNTWRELDPGLELYDYWVIDNIALAGPSSVSEVADEVRVFPNPTRAGFQVSLGSTPAGSGARLLVYDAIGRTRHTAFLASTATEAQVWTHEWAPGVYAVALERGDGTRAVTRVVVR